MAEHEEEEEYMHSYDEREEKEEEEGDLLLPCDGLPTNKLPPPPPAPTSTTTTTAGPTATRTSHTNNQKGHRRMLSDQTITVEQIVARKHTRFALLLSDLHFRVQNNQQSNLLIDEVIRVCSETKDQIDVIILAGDMLHTNLVMHAVPLQNLSRLLAFLTTIAPVYALVGNHELSHHRAVLSSDHALHVFKPYPNVTIVDTLPRTWQHPATGVTILMCPYVAPGALLCTLENWATTTTAAAAAASAVEREGSPPPPPPASSSWMDNVDCLVCHQEFRGCLFFGGGGGGAGGGANHNNMRSESGDVYPRDAPPVFSGHIHERQVIPPNILYPGALLQSSYGNESHRSSLLFLPLLAEFSSSSGGGTRKMSVTKDAWFVDLTLPRMRTLRISAANLFVQKQQQKQQQSHDDDDDACSVLEAKLAQAPEDTWRVVITGTAGELKAVTTTEAYGRISKRAQKMVLALSTFVDDNSARTAIIAAAAAETTTTSQKMMMNFEAEEEEKEGEDNNNNDNDTDSCSDNEKPPLPQQLPAPEEQARIIFYRALHTYLRLKKARATEGSSSLSSSSSSCRGGGGGGTGNKKRRRTGWCEEVAMATDEKTEGGAIVGEKKEEDGEQGGEEGTYAIKLIGLHQKLTQRQHLS